MSACDSLRAVSDVSIQDRLFPQAACFGCGPSNSKGLRLKSFPRDGEVVATFEPWPEHDNGVGFLNGGIISTLLDCHSAAAVMDEASRQDWLPLPGAALSYVTAGLDVRFLRPAPLHDPVELRATLTSVSEAEMICGVELLFDGKQRATADAIWRRWRPR
jgi:acyl-coenzyme A thioesterase PaaI-like protein